MDSGNIPRTLPALASPFADLTVARTAPEAIRSMTFKTTRKGFDPKEVSAYLDRLAGDVEILHNRLRRFEGQAETPPAPIPHIAESPIQSAVRPADAPPADALLRPCDEDPFENAGSRVAELMRTLEEDVRVAEREAKTEADELLASARAEADELRLEARLAREEAAADAASVVASAHSDADRIQAEANRILHAISSDRQGMIEDVRRLREGLVLTLARIEAMIDEREEIDRPIVVDETEHARSR